MRGQIGDLNESKEDVILSVRSEEAANSSLLGNEQRCPELCGIAGFTTKNWSAPPERMRPGNRDADSQGAGPTRRFSIESFFDRCGPSEKLSIWTPETSRSSPRMAISESPSTGQSHDSSSPVEGDSEIAILGEDRLVSGVQIDNFQTGRTYRKKIRLKNALLVRPPVNQRRGCLAHPLRRRAPVFSCESAIPHNSGHLSLVAEQNSN